MHVASLVFFFIHLWLMEAIFIFSWLSLLIIFRILARMVILYSPSSIFFILIHLLIAMIVLASFRMSFWIIFKITCFFMLFRAWLFLTGIFAIFMRTVLLLNFRSIFHSSTLNQEWSFEDFGIDLYHLVFILHFLSFFLSFEFLDFISNNRSWFVDIYMARFQSLTDYWSKFFFSELTNSIRTLLFLHLFLLLLKLTATKLN